MLVGVRLAWGFAGKDHAAFSRWDIRPSSVMAYLRALAVGHPPRLLSLSPPGALMAAMPDASLDRIVILFPDPWPKARHHKRRLVQDDFVAEAVRLLKPGGRLRFATDWADYADWALRRLTASPHLAWLAETADDWRKPPADHVTTRYEEKRLGDCAPIWLEFERTAA